MAFNVGDTVRVVNWGGRWDGVEGVIESFDGTYWRLTHGLDAPKPTSGWTECYLELVKPARPAPKFEVGNLVKIRKADRYGDSTRAVVLGFEYYEAFEEYEYDVVYVNGTSGRGERDWRGESELKRDK